MNAAAMPTSATERKIPSLNGVNQSYKFAKPIVGDGLGEIVLIVQVADLGVAPFYLCDGVNESSRLYAYKNGAEAGDYHCASGITATVNEISNTPVYGELCKIVIAGNFDGLMLERLFSRYSDTEYAQVRPLYFSYKDQSQFYDTDFGSGKPFEVFGESGRDLAVNQLIPAGSATLVDNTITFTDDGWAYVGEDVVTVVGQVYEVRGLAKVSQSNGRWSVIAWSKPGYAVLSSVESVSGGDVVAYIRATTTLTRIGLSKLSGGTASDTLTKEVLSIREVPNALMLQSPAADPADDWAEYVQRPDGIWRGKKNLSSFRIATCEASADLYEIVASALDALSVDEEYFVSLVPDIEQGKLQLLVGNTGPSWGATDNNVNQVFEWESRSHGHLRARPLEVPCVGSLNSIRVNHKIGLSDYLVKQHQIQQVEKAIADYKARYDKSRYLTNADGVDDFAVFDCRPATGDFDCYITAELSDADSWSTLVSLNDARFTLTSADHGGHVRFDTVGNAYPPFAGGSYEVSKFFTYSLHRRGDVLAIKQDGEPLGTVSGYSPASVVLKQALMDVSGIGGSDGFVGHVKDIIWIDHEQPLPVGRGGNSLFLPLDDSDDVARQVLGLDSKGNLVAGKSKGLNEDIWEFGDVIPDGSVGIYGVLAGKYGSELPENIPILVTVSWENITGRLGFLIGSDAKYTTPDMVNNTDSLTYLTDTVTERRAVVQSGAANMIGGRIKVKVQRAYGFGQWQGNPDRELYNLEKASGGFLGPDQVYLRGIPDDYVLNSDGSYTSTAPFQWLYVRQNIQFTDFDVRLGFTCDGEVAVEGVTYPVGEHVIDLPANSVYPRIAIKVVGTTVGQVTVRPLIRLSAELQRQYDLAMIEKKIARLDRLYGKAMPLLNLDGVDDGIAFPDWRVSGNFKVPFSFKTESTGITYLLGSNTYSYLRLNNGSLRFRLFALDGSSYKSVEINGLNDGLLHAGYFGVIDGMQTLVVDGQKKATTPIADFSMLIDRVGIRNASFFDGYTGAIPLIDYAEPLKSRYYVATEFGLTDMLAATGPDLWSFGDAVINLSTHDLDAEIQNIDPVSVGDVFLVSGDNQTGKSLLFWVGDRGNNGLIPPGPFNVAVVAVAGSKMGFRSKFGQTPVVGSIVNVSVLKQPNAGIYQGNPDAPQTFIKSGDDWVNEKPRPDSFSVYGLAGDVTHSFPGNRVRIDSERDGSRYIGIKIHGGSVGDYLVTVKNVLSQGLWKANDHTIDVTGDGTIQFILRNTERVIIENRSGVSSDFWEGEVSIQQVIKGA